MSDQRQYANIRVYYDTESNPDNPGYVVSYDAQAWSHQHHAWDTVQTGLTAALDAETTEDALADAAELLDVSPETIHVE